MVLIYKNVLYIEQWSRFPKYERCCQAGGYLKYGASLKLVARWTFIGLTTILPSLLVSQEPAPMTEDTLEEQSEVLAKLGTSAEGSQLRARMQSASLLSDMESFKVTLLSCAVS